MNIFKLHKCYECGNDLSYNHALSYSHTQYIKQLRLKGIVPSLDSDYESIEKEHRKIFDTWWESDNIAFYCCSCYEKNKSFSFCDGCGKVIVYERSEHGWLCEPCKEQVIEYENERRERLNQRLERIRAMFGLEKVIDEIAGGTGQDNDLQEFNDYYATLYRMKEMLEREGFNPPFTIISDEETKRYAGMEHHIQNIACEYDFGEVYEITPNIYCKVKKICVNEREFVESRKWIKEWIVNDNIKEHYQDYRLILVSDKVGVITGSLSLT